MKNFRNLCLISISFFILFILNSCNKNEAVIQNSNDNDSAKSFEIGGIKLEGLKIVDGVMHFKDAKSFAMIHDLISNSNFKNYSDFLQNTKFESIWSEFIKIQNEVEILVDNSDIAGVNHLYEINNDILLKKDDYVDIRIQAIPISKLISRERILYIGKVLYYYDENGQISIESGKKEILRQILANSLSTFPSGIRKSSNISENNSFLRSACSLTFDSGWQVSPTNSSRRGIVGYKNLVYEINVGSSLYDYHFYSLIDARSQKKVLGAWYSYSTDHTLNILELTDRFRIEYNSGTINTITTNGLIQTFVNQSSLSTSVYRNTWAMSQFVQSPGNTPNVLTSQSMNINYTNGGGCNINLICN